MRTWIQSIEWWGAARLSIGTNSERLDMKGFDEYYSAGMEAYQNGDHKLAHDLWREAATHDPFQEKLWVALLHVLETNDDRRVCVENILAINPANIKARREYNRLQHAQKATQKRKRELARPLRFALAFGRGLLIGLIASGIGIGVSIIVYGNILQ
ncbi:MAG: hypothetical protein SF162_12940 [bacterium]|nr:hypothetical protein [bacterium]